MKLMIPHPRPTRVADFAGKHGEPISPPPPPPAVRIERNDADAERDQSRDSGEPYPQTLKKNKEAIYR